MSHALQALWWVCHYLVMKPGQVILPSQDPVQGCWKTFRIPQIRKTHSRNRAKEWIIAGCMQRREKIRWNLTDLCGGIGSLQQETLTRYSKNREINKSWAAEGIKSVTWQYVRNILHQQVGMKIYTWTWNSSWDKKANTVWIKWEINRQ